MWVMSLQKAIELTVSLEGGWDAYSNDPDDPGGATKAGITQRLLNAWNRERGVDWMNVKSILPSTIGLCYADNFYRSSLYRCGALPEPLDAVFMQAVVNCGGHPIDWLQRLAGVTPDGIMGPQTIAHAAEVSPLALLEQQDAYYNMLGDPHFLRGWLNRTIRVRKWLATGNANG
jgi:lysozyme family protein